MPITASRAICIGAASVAIASSCFGAQAVKHRILALTGTDGPLGPQRGPGAVFTDFSSPRINATGDCLVSADAVNGNSGPGLDGLWFFQDFKPRLVMRVGDPIPGIADGDRVASVGGAFLRDSGDLLVEAQAESASVPSQPLGARYYLVRQDTWSLVYARGDVLPGSPDPILSGLRSYSSRGFHFYTSTLGAWEFSDQGVRPVFVARAPAPGIPAGFTFGPFDVYEQVAPMSRNDRGDSVLAITHSVDAGPPAVGVFFEHSGVAYSLLRNGDPAPGFADGTTIAQIGRGQYPSTDDDIRPVLNDAGDVVFRTTVRRPGGIEVPTIYARISGSLNLVAACAHTTPIAEPGTVFTMLESPVIAGNGWVGYRATVARLSGESFDHQCLIVGPHDRFRIVARQGQRAPGTPEGVVFESFQTFQLNAHGQALFHATVSGPGVTSLNRAGLWHATPDGQVFPVLRQRDQIMVGPGDTRTISSFLNLVLTGGQDGRPVQFNDDATAVISLRFTDNTRAILQTWLVGRCDGDLNQDSVVNGADLSILLGSFGRPIVSGASPADINNDGFVNGLDLSILLGSFDVPCG